MSAIPDDRHPRQREWLYGTSAQERSTCGDAIRRQRDADIAPSASSRGVVVQPLRDWARHHGGGAGGMTGAPPAHGLDKRGASAGGHPSTVSPISARRRNSIIDGNDTMSTAVRCATSESTSRMPSTVRMSSKSASRSIGMFEQYARRRSASGPSMALGRGPGLDADMTVSASSRHCRRGLSVVGRCRLPQGHRPRSGVGFRRRRELAATELEDPRA